MSKGLVSNQLRLPYRGGNWNNTSNAGLGYVNLNNARSNTNTNIGVRPASAHFPKSEVLSLRGEIQCLSERIQGPRLQLMDRKNLSDQRVVPGVLNICLQVIERPGKPAVRDLIGGPYLR